MLSRAWVDAASVEAVGLFCRVLNFPAWWSSYFVIHCSPWLKIFRAIDFHLPSGLIYSKRNLWDFILILIFAFSVLVFISWGALFILHAAPWTGHFSVVLFTVEISLLQSSYSGAGDIILSYPCGCQYIFLFIDVSSGLNSVSSLALEQHTIIILKKKKKLEKKIILESLQKGFGRHFKYQANHPVRDLCSRRLAKCKGGKCVSNLSLRSSFGIQIWVIWWAQK